MLKKLIQTSPVNASTLPIRLALAAIFIGHGGQKLFGLFGGSGLEATTQAFASMGLEPASMMAALAGGGEFFGGILVGLGLLTRFGALSIAITMAVAIATVHSGAFFLSDHGMEYCLMLAAAAVTLIITGGGAMSVDTMVLDILQKSPTPATKA